MWDPPSNTRVLQKKRADNYSKIKNPFGASGLYSTFWVNISMHIVLAGRNKKGKNRKKILSSQLFGHVNITKHFEKLTSPT